MAKLTGTNPDQVPTNADLGTMAYQDKDNVKIDGGSINLKDNDKIQLGDSSDLQIYHDSNNSYISEQGQGVLYIQGSGNVQIESATGENMAVFLADNAVELYYDNGKRLNTTSTGVNITGTLASDSGDVAGELIAGSYNETYAAVTSSSNATTVNCHNGNAFSHTLTENTTFTFSNPPASGTAYSFSIEIIQDASASGYTVTWPSSVDWPNATAPTLTATASAKDVFVFYTRDGGTNWYGFTAGQALG